MPKGHAAWLAVPDACLCATIFIAGFNDRVPTLLSSNGTSLAWIFEYPRAMISVGEFRC